MKGSLAAAFAVVSGVTLAGWSGFHTSAPAAGVNSVTVPLRAQQTDIVDAYDILHRLGLRVAVTKETAVTSLAVPVVRLSPRAGMRVPRGSVVNVTPEHGPVGSPAVLTSHPRYRVPDFDGRPLRAAVRWADAHQMFWAVPRLPRLPASSAAHLFDAYRVVGQQPQAGGTIVQGVMIGRGFKPTPLTLRVVRR